MCGLAGCLDPRAELRAEELDSAVEAMAASLVHRGPDDGGVWSDPAAGIGLGSRRLAVLDLSAEGHQPMSSASGRFVVAYNGEIYNYEQLRRRLEGTGSRFRGGSDTEVLLAAVEAWGFEPTIESLNGMFAFALWDRREHVLTLARDRLGEKPLYYGFSGSALLFASELKAFEAFPGFKATVDRESVARYFRYGRVPAPFSIYEGVRQLEPGCYLAVHASADIGRSLEPVRYWSAHAAATSGASSPLSGTTEQVVDELEALLADAVAMRIHADVPVGCFLSGGVDSSTVAALMRSVTNGPVRTFTIGFDDPAYDESKHAAAVARLLGTEHTELRLTSKDALEVIPQLPRIYDEPFADTSQIPTFLVSRLARQHVTVALSGDGGDELFGGYNRHSVGSTVASWSKRVPSRLRRGVARALAAPSPATWDRLFAVAGTVLPRRAQVRLPGLEIQKLASVLPAEGPDELYQVLASTWPDPGRLVVGAEGASGADPCDVPAALADAASRMMYLDLVSYLPDDILVKLDRASMAVSLESRVPILDHRVVELAWRIPPDLKVRAGSGKWVLRQVLGRHVPAELVERPKSGFGLPIDRWLRGPLSAWAEELIEPDRLAAEGYLRADAVRRHWQEHLSGRFDHTDRLWAVLMFQSWLAEHQR